MKFREASRLGPLFIGIIAVVIPSAAAVTDIGDRRELFVEDSLIERLEGGAQLRMHRPVPQEIAIVHDAPWEGTGSGYHSIFEDDGVYRMYYKAWQLNAMNAARRDPNEKPNPLVCAYAESDDGINWRKPELGLNAFDGSTANNIVMLSKTVGSLEVDAGHPAVFKDSNPAAPADARYKAFFRSKGEQEGLLAFKSADGLSWEPMADHPVITAGKFDSQNLAFWDEVAGVYRAYWRSFTPPEKENDTGVRSIRTGTSPDFINWEVLGDLTYIDSPLEQLYTNQIKPYHRAPHLLIGFPNRYIERGHEHQPQRDAASARIAGNDAGGERSENWSDAMKALPEPEHRKMRAEARERYGIALTEALLIAGRDGQNFKRWNDAFLPPGIERPGTWNYGQQYLAWHVVETKSALAGAPNELSLYAVESYWTEPGSALRRYTLRMDGFVSVRAPASGGELVTKPIRFEGSRLALNFGTSAAGSVRVEIQDEAGNPLPGFALADCAPLYGNAIDRPMTWTSGRDLSELAGTAVRLRFVLHDADVYAYQFQL